jgi:hypothetical protein
MANKPTSGLKPRTWWELSRQEKLANTLYPNLSGRKQEMLNIVRLTDPGQLSAFDRRVKGLGEKKAATPPSTPPSYPWWKTERK